MTKLMVATMKTRQDSPRPELIRLGTFRLDTAAESPKLQSDEVSSFDMNSNATNGSPRDPTTPSIQHDNSSVSALPLEPVSDQNTPSRQPLPNVDLTTSPQASDVECSTSLSPVMSNLDTPALEIQALQWSAAVGRATTGKSGRVIERLMGENDRLRRELKHQSLRCEEEAKRSETARSKSDSLQATNENLVTMREVDKSALSRRERKIEELKADLEGERTRRERAERETKETSKERDEVVGKCKREVMAEKENARKSTTQYEVLSSSWRSLTDGYRRQMEELKADIKMLNGMRAEDRTKLETLEIVIEQTRQEGNKMSKANEAVSNKFEDYKAETEKEIKGIKERAERNEQASQRALEEMGRVVGEMRYVINLKKDVQRAE